MVWQQENQFYYKDFLERYKIINFVFIVLFLFLSFRLFQIQVINGNSYFLLSEKQRTYIIPERAPRGIIYDYKGKILAENKSSFVALFYPFSQNSTPDWDSVKMLDRILNKENIAISIINAWRQGRLVRIAEDLSREQMFQILEQRLILPGISVINESRRSYPSPEANSHVVGYMSEITKKELDILGTEGYRIGDWIGRGGIEQIYERYLRGQNGGWQIEIDALGRQTKIVKHIPSYIGNSIHTTIDSTLQDIAYNALKKSFSGKGAVVGIDPRSGAVRILVSSPGFDPSISFSPLFSKYLRNEELPLYNRAIQALYPPGSTFKVITFIAAISNGYFNPEQKFICKGKFTFGNSTFNCWEKKGHGSLSLIPALAKSCNVYFYQLGLKIGMEPIIEYAKKFCLGESTGIDLASEKSGLVPNKEWKLKRLKEPWHPGDTINLAIGQGALWVTPIQMAVLISAIANGGTVYQPYIVDRITNPSNETIFRFRIKKKTEIKLSEGIWNLLKVGLREVVTNGTGGACYIPNISVAGKTGTAQNPLGQDHAWFIGYAPTDNPILALSVIVENGGSGGAVAAPIAREIFIGMFDEQNKQD